MTRNNNDDNFEMIHGKRVLKDKGRLRVPMIARDGRSINPYLTEVQRAVATDAAARDARAKAYELYDQWVGQAWRNGDADPWSEDNPPVGAGSKGPRGQQPGMACTINGARGSLQMVNGALQCIPLQSNDSSQFTDGYSNDPTALHRPG